MTKKALALLAIICASIIILAILLAVLIRSKSTPMTSLEVERAIRDRLDTIVVGNDDVRNAALVVDSPSLGITLRHGSGMPENALYHSASVGKLFTAATVFSLVNDGILDLDTPIDTYIDTDPWVGLLTIDGVDRLGDLTIRQLLSHRTGLPDHFEDKPDDGSPRTMELILAEPDRTWTIESRLEYVRDHYQPVGVPGSDYHYADTNYDLLGLVIESVSGDDFDSVRQERALDAGNMIASGAWSPEQALTELWFNGIEVSGYNSLSIDGPGGGLVLTLDDQVRFMRALVTGEGLPALESFKPEEGEAWGQFVRGIDYGYGLMVIRPELLSPFMKGYPSLYGHSGVTGTYLYYVPEYDAVIAGTFNNSEWGGRRHIVFILEILNYLQRAYSL